MKNGYNTGKTEEVLKKFLGDGDRSSHVVKLLGDGYQGSRVETDVVGYPIGVFVDPCQYISGSSKISIGMKGYAGIIFHIGPYPKCCGLKMFYNFMVSNRIPQEVVNELLTAFFKENHSEVNDSYMPLGGCNRIEVVMVETGRRGMPEYTDMSVSIPPVDKPLMQYPQLWKFFHECCTVTHDRLSYNANSGNILHNMEVLLPK